MEENKDGKRRKDRHGDDDDNPREKRSKRARSRSRSPVGARQTDSRRKRRLSRSRSPDIHFKQERRRDEPPQGMQVNKELPVRKAKDTDMLNTRTGGAYIPPARLRMMQAQITDKSSVAYQRLAWEALKKSIHGHINKINVGNIGIITKELLKENIVRGRGLLCRSVIQAQSASPTFTNVYAALVAAVNSRFPNIGELLLKRLVIQFKRGFKRNDKPICISSASFIAHLVNQRVAHEILALELLTLLVETPTDDSVEVAIAFLKECGQKLTEVSSKGVNAIFEMLRNILHEGQLDKRVQYMIEVMFQVWKDGFKDHPALIEELELVPEEDQFTHLLMLDDATDPQDILNVFKFDDKYEENEEKYKTLCKDILGSDAESGDEEGSGGSGSEESEEEEGDEGEQKDVTIVDRTETNLVALRRTIYLTINSSLDFEECAHKLMKMQLKPGQEIELCHMFLDCCAEQRTYEKFYGLLAQRFCNINRIYIGPFEEIFKDSYGTAHRLDTNRLRNVSKFFAHLLFTDSISWEVMECVKLNEEDTTSSSRIYIKILFQELAEYMGLKKLNDRLKDQSLQEAFSGIFPRDNPKNTRFSINFFTSIGLGGLTDELREHLKQMPKNVPAPITDINLGSSSSDSSSSSSSDDSSSDSSSSEDESNKKQKDKSNKSKQSKDKNKDKDKTPKTPEENASHKESDRWGHDGFYDTYGKDARRFGSRPDRQERDNDNFVKPRDVRRNDDRSRNRDYEQRNGDDRRDESGKRREDRRQDDDESRRNREYERRHDRDNRDGDRGDFRGSRRNYDGEKRRDTNAEDPRAMGNTDESRFRKEKSTDGARPRNEKDTKSRREEDPKSRSNDDNEKSKEDCRSSKREYDGERRRDVNSEESRSRRDTEESRSRKEKSTDEVRSKNEKDTRSKREDKARTETDEDEQRNRKKNNKDDRRKRSRSRSSSQDEQARNQHREKENRGDKEKDKDGRKKKGAEDSSDEDQNRRKNDKRKTQLISSEEICIKNRRKDRQSTDNQGKKKNSRKDKEESSDEDSDRNNDREKRRKKGKKSESSSDEEKYEKENRKNADDSRSKRDRKKKQDSSEDDSRSRKQSKVKKRSRKQLEDGWDIRRGSSLRRELEGGRYWAS